MSYPLVLGGETASVYEISNPAAEPRVTECMDAYLTHQFGGLATAQSIGQYREVLTPGTDNYYYEGSHSPIDINCLAVVEQAEDKERQGRVLAVSNFGRANDPSITKPEVASFNAAVAGTMDGATPPPIGWVEMVAWDPTMSHERREQVVPFLLRAVSDKMAHDGFATAAYAALPKPAEVISQQAVRLDLEGGLLQTRKSPPGWIEDGLRDPEATPQVRRTLFMFNVGVVRRVLEGAKV